MEDHFSCLHFAPLKGKQKKTQLGDVGASHLEDSHLQLSKEQKKVPSMQFKFQIRKIPQNLNFENLGLI